MRYFFCTFSLSSPHHLDAIIVFVYQDNSSFIWATKSTLPSSSSPFVLFPIITWFGLLPYKNHPTTIPHPIQIDILQQIRVTTNPEKITYQHLDLKKNLFGRYVNKYKLHFNCTNSTVIKRLVMLNSLKYVH